MSHGATVTRIEQLAPAVVQLTVRFEQSAFEFAPGQWVNFRFPEGVSRAYTIASSPEKPDELQLCVRVGPGKGGEALTRLGSGAAVTVEGPYGDFVLPDSDDRPVVFFAGDTGIAPVRSIVLHLLAVGDARQLTVLYEPDRRHILYAADFDPLARSGAIVHESGRIETLISRNRRRITGAVAMAAGFDGFLRRARRALSEDDIAPAEMITESFGPEP
ncbi:MAG TPA: FAD-binding oxidoreductase [Thermoanaerobaculia bacterium]|nr:FAD-binding oxidoreductase [Thermoanaerobaculia bacterium]